MFQAYSKTVGNLPESKVHGANMGPTCVLSAPDGPHVGPRTVVNTVPNRAEPSVGTMVPYHPFTCITNLTHWGQDKIATTLADITFKYKFVNENVLILIK